MKLKDSFFILSIVAVLCLVSNFVGSNNGIMKSVPGMIILAALTMAGILLNKIIPLKIPSVAYVVVLGCIVTVPGFPGADMVNEWMKNISFISLTTPILAYAGIALTKDIDTFKKTGWKIIVVSCAVFIGTYLGSALIAQTILKALGQI
ncbi:DUF340 domain-containing protein [Clostridium sp.]|uniref:DUF340 domain-containing protein n=1 Tax=Clostridium sp. TaxID=1506 RepID=UPI001A48DA9C|nr:DUF340 domain-containing protein [Clostridium sp.]MBK5242306.1 DUF340 domain-containing protein [Clostridium sp.]